MYHIRLYKSSDNIIVIQNERELFVCIYLRA